MTGLRFPPKRDVCNTAVSMRQLDLSHMVPRTELGGRSSGIGVFVCIADAKRKMSVSQRVQNNTFTAVSCMSVRRKSKGNSRTTIRNVTLIKVSSHQPSGTRAASYYALSREFTAISAMDVS